MNTDTENTDPITYAHVKGYIPAIGWHVASLLEGKLTSFPVSVEDVAKHYDATPKMIDSIYNATMAIVRRNQ